MRCFGSGKPNLSSKDVTINKKNKTIFTYLTQLSEEGNCQNANGTTLFDSSGVLKKTNSFAMLTSLQYGQALCAPCDISTCPCFISLPDAVITDLSENSGITGLSYGVPIEVPWNFIENPQSWNANNVILDGTGIQYFTLCGPSGNTWAYDGSSNVLDGSGMITFDGSGVCYNSVFTQGCSNNYYPNGTIAMNTTDALVALGAAGISGAPAGARPEVNIFNYLQNVSGFKQPSRIRFHR